MKTESSRSETGAGAPGDGAAAKRGVGSWLWMALAVLLPLLYAGVLLTRSPVRHMAELPPSVGDLQLDYRSLSGREEYQPGDPLKGFAPLWPDSGFPVDARILAENRTLQLVPRERIELPSPYITWQRADGSELALGHVTFARAEDVPLPPDFGLPGWSGTFLLRTPFQDEPLARASVPGSIWKGSGE